MDPPSVPTYPAWIDHLPGWIARAFKKYGWLYGLRMAVSGAVFAVMGFVAKATFGSMGDMVMSEDFSGFGDVTFYDEAGHMVDPSHFGLTSNNLNALGHTYGYSTFSMTEPFDIFCNFIILIGLAMLVGGLMLAWYLKKRGQESA